MRGHSFRFRASLGNDGRPIKVDGGPTGNHFRPYEQAPITSLRPNKVES